MPVISTVTSLRKVSQSTPHSKSYYHNECCLWTYCTRNREYSCLQLKYPILLLMAMLSHQLGLDHELHIQTQFCDSLRKVYATSEICIVTNIHQIFLFTLKKRYFSQLRALYCNMMSVIISKSIGVTELSSTYAGSYRLDSCCCCRWNFAINWCYSRCISLNH